MIKAVIDTNILISGLISSKGTPAKIISLWHKRKFIFISSPAIIDELKDVLNYPKIYKKYHFNGLIIDKYLKMVKAFAQICHPKEKLEVITADIEDNKFLEVAVFSGANYIVSGDKHLLHLKDYQGVKIIKAEEFLKVVKYG